jgi:response regulator RpfG family c-di-GMP phosphodiesterase
MKEYNKEAFKVAALWAYSSDRPYRVAITHDDAISEIKKERGRLYDPAVVDVVIELSARGQLSV